MKRITELAETLILIPIVSLFGMLTYMALDREPPGKPGKVLEAYVEQNQILLAYEFTRYRACDVSVFRQIVKDGAVTTLLPMQVPAGQIERMEEETPSLVKQVLPMPLGGIGPTTLRVTLDYACNPLQKLWPLRVEYDLTFTPEARK